ALVSGSRPSAGTTKNVERRQIHGNAIPIFVAPAEAGVQASRAWRAALVSGSRPSAGTTKNVERRQIHGNAIPIFVAPAEAGVQASRAVARRSCVWLPARLRDGEQC